MNPRGIAGSHGRIHWPGPDFELKKILPGSLYLWACGERGDGDGAANISCPERCASWVVLITQFLCYAELWSVSGTHPPGGSQTSREYSILAIAVAMYLILSIAAADLWGALALILEGRGSGNFILLTFRRTFGMCLLITFGALVGASTRVLFYSSFEDVDLVLGAAAVLFIADVDEKAMTVLNSVGGEWRLFWVLEAIGLSFGLALLAIQLTGNGDTLNKGLCGESVWWESYCGSIYDWRFIVNIYPTAVTAVALVAVRAVSRPDVSLVVRVLRPPSWKWFRFSLIVVVWVLCQALFRSPALYLANLTTTVAPVTSMQEGEPVSLRTSIGLFLLPLGGIALLVRCDYCRRLKLAWIRGSPRFRPVDRQWRCWLFWSGILFFLVELTFELLDYYRSEYYPVFYSLVELLNASHAMATRAWFIFGMELTEIRSPSYLIVDPARALPPPLISMLIGWCLYEGIEALHFFIMSWWYFVFDDDIAMSDRLYFAQIIIERVGRIMWDLMLGSLLWGWTLEVRDIAYWHVATILVSDLATCVGEWIHAAFVGIVE